MQLGALVLLGAHDVIAHGATLLGLRFGLEERCGLEAARLSFLEAIHDLAAGRVREWGADVTGIGVGQIRFANGPRGAQRGAGLTERIRGYLTVGAQGALEALAGLRALAGGTAVVVVL